MSNGGVGFGGGVRSKSANGLVAAGVLCCIESAVGEGEDLFVGNVDGRIHVPRKGGPANRHGAVQRKARAFDLERLARNRGENARGERGGFLALAKAGDDEKFFAAPANQDVGIANRGADAGGQFDEHLITGIVAEAVVDFFEVIGVDEVEDDVAIAAAARGIGRRVGADGLADVALDSGLEEAAVARFGQWIGERHLFKFLVGLREGFTAFCDSLFESETLALEFARAVIHEGVECQDAEKNGETAGVPALPPSRNHRKRKFRRKTESAASGAARDGEAIIARRKSWIASFAAGGFIKFSFEARQAIRATDIFRVAERESREVHVEGIIAARSLGMALADAVARAELCGGNDHTWRKLDTVVGRDRIVARQATAGAEEQGAVFFGEKAALA